LGLRTEAATGKGTAEIQISGGSENQEKRNLSTHYQGAGEGSSPVPKDNQGEGGEYPLREKSAEKVEKKCRHRGEKS